MYGPLSKYLRILKAVAFTLLLAVYLMGAMKLNGFHEFFHSHDHGITHLQQDEADGCHRAVYHNDKKGCDHKIHISANHHCQLCDFILTADQETESNVHAERSPQITLHQNFNQFFTELSPALLLRSRAPPAC
jgi:hypothetical protein